MFTIVEARPPRRLSCARSTAAVRTPASCPPPDWSTPACTTVLVLRPDRRRASLILTTGLRARDLRRPSVNPGAPPGAGLERERAPGPRAAPGGRRRPDPHRPGCCARSASGTRRSRSTCSRCRTTPRCSRATRTSGASTSPTRPPGSRTGAARASRRALRRRGRRDGRPPGGQDADRGAARGSRRPTPRGDRRARERPALHASRRPAAAVPDGREPHQVELIGSLGAAFGVAPDADLSPRLYLSDREREAAASGLGGGRAGRSGAGPAGPDQHLDFPGPGAVAALARRPVRRARRPPAPRAPGRRPRGALAAARSRCSRARRRQRGRRGPRAVAAGDVRRRPGSLRMFALVAAADLVFTPDTGVVHVASAFGTPAVVVTLPEALTFAPYRIPGATLRRARAGTSRRSGSSRRRPRWTPRWERGAAGVEAGGWHRGRLALCLGVGDTCEPP